MAESILNGKSILAVDDEPDVLAILEEEILTACPRCTFDKATTYEQANELIETVPKKTENSIVKNQRKSKSLIFTGSKIFAGQ